MPIVPSYNEPQVAPSPDPGAAIRNPSRFVIPEAFGVPLGQAGENVGETLFRAGMQADALRNEDALTQVQRNHMQLAQGDGQNEPGAFNLKGRQVMPTPGADPNSDEAKPLTDRYMAKATAYEAQVRAGLSNDQQRAMFDQGVAKLNMAFQGQLRQHEVKQTGLAMQDMTANGIDVATQAAALAVQNGDQDAAEMNRQRAISLSRQFATLNGMDPDAAQQEATSQIGSAIVTSYLQAGNTKAAQAYLDGHPQDFTLKAAEGLQAQLKGKVQLNTAFTAANQIYDAAAAEAGPDGVPSLTDMTSKLRDQFKDDAETFTKASAFLKERLNDQIQAQHQQDDAVEGTLWKGIVQGGSLHDAVTSPLFQHLTGEKQAAFIKGVQTFQKKEDDGDGQAAMDKFMNYWSLVQNPSLLSQMSDDEVYKMGPKLGLPLMKQLLTYKADLAQPGKVKSAEASTAQFAFWAHQAGIDTSAKASDDDRAKLGQLHLDANALLEAERQARGRDLTASEQDDLFKNLITTKIVQTKPGVLWGTNTTETPLYQAMTKDDITKVMGIYRKHGITNPTAAQIIQGYQELSK